MWMERNDGASVNISDEMDTEQVQNEQPRIFEDEMVITEYERAYLNTAQEGIVRQSAGCQEAQSGPPRQ